MRGLKFAIIGVVLAPLLAGLTELVGLLVAVGAAAAVAAAGLGGALIGAIGAAIPVIGLLVVAFKQLFDIVKLASDQQKNAIQVSKDASKRSLEHTQQLYAEKQAHQAVTDAQKQLIIARREAIRQIQDLNNAEKEAILTSQRATLGLIGSKAALAGLVSGGGSALDVASAQLDVQSAQQSIPQAQLQLGRASQDASRARRQGVAGNPQVVSAQRNVIQTQQQLILQQRQFAQANKDAAQATTDLTTRFNKLTPAGKGLLAAVVALRKEFKTEWKGITDPILNAFTGVVKGITDTLKDPAIKEAFKALAGSTGQFVTQSTNFFFTPEARQQFLDLIKGARTDLPIIASILNSFEKIFGRIAVAAQPFVTKILGGIDSFISDLASKTGNKNALADFFNNAFQALNAFWGVLQGVWSILRALGSNGAFSTGVALLNQLAGYLKGVGTELNNNGPAVQRFFDRVGKVAGLLGTLLDHVFTDLIKIANTGAFEGLIKILDNAVLPLLTYLLIAIGKVISAFGDLSETNPEIAKLIIIIGGIGIALVKIIPILDTVGISVTALFGPAGLIIIGIAAVIAAIILLDRKFHFLAPTFKWIGNQFDQIKTNASKNFEDIQTAAGVLGDKLKPIFDRIGNHYIDKWIIDKLGGGNSIKSNLIDIVEWLDTHSLIDAFREAFNGIGKLIDAANDKIDALQKKLGLIGKILGFSGKDLFNAVSGSGAPDSGFKGNRGTAGTGGGGGGGPVTAAQIAKAAAVVGGGGGSGGGQKGGGRGEGGLTEDDAKKVLSLIVGDANAINGKYQYSFGGGHGKPLSPGGPKNGFDCSGAVSGLLAAAGLIPGTTDTTGLASELIPGAGSGQLVVWVKSTGDPHQSHTFMDIAGHRFEYGGYDNATGWSNRGDTSGFQQYHPRGFASGGWVPGSGNSDSVPAWLTPGEAVLTKAHQAMLGGSRVLKKVFAYAAGTLSVPHPVVKPVTSRGGEAIPTDTVTGEGSSKLIAAFVAMDQFFTDQANKLAKLVQRQKSKLVNARYLVAGSGSSTTVVDTGSDLQDAQQNRSNLGVARDAINAQLSSANGEVSKIRAQIAATPNTKANHDLRQLLNSQVKHFQETAAGLQDQLNQNTLDLLAAQTVVIQAQVDQIQATAQRAINSSQFQIAIAQLTGIGRGSIPGLIQQQIESLVGEKSALWGALQQAANQGNVVLYNNILDTITGIDQQIVQLADDKFQAVVSAINDTANINLTSNDIASRLNALGGNSLNSLQGQGAILQNRGQILQSQLSALSFSNFAPNSLTPAETLQIQQQQQELQAAIAENTDALRDNGEQLKQAHVDQINNLASFRGGISSGVTGLISSLASLTQQFDLPTQIKNLNNQQSNLQTQGSGLRQQLSQQFGVNLSSDPSKLLTQLTNTDFGALEFGMDDNTKSLFESLINGIIGNATALVDNTSELNKANGQLTTQDWTSSLWQNFRDALFTGNGQIVSGAGPAVSSSSFNAASLMPSSSGFVPSKVSPGGASNQVVVNVDNRGEGDVDVDYLSSRIGWELATQ